MEREEIEGMALLNTLLSYLLLLLISAGLIGAGVALGITLRIRKNRQEEAADQDPAGQNALGQSTAVQDSAARDVPIQKAES